MSSHTLTPTQQMLGLCTLGVLCLLGAIAFVWRDMHAMHMQNIDLLYERAYAEARVDQMAHVRSRATVLADDRKALDGFLIRESDVILLLEEIEYLGVVAGTSVSIDSVDTVSVSSGEDAPEVPMVRISIEVEGTWEAIIQTITLLELLPFFSTIDDVRIATRQPSGWRATLTLMLPRQQ